MASSRISMAIKNAKFAMFFYFVNLLLQFFSRKVFIDFLGAEILGLNSTLMSILEFLNLSASGIGIATAYSLYKPLSTNNRQEVVEKISLLGWFYRRVAIIVIIFSLVVMSFFPRIFATITFPLWYTYATFAVFLVATLLGYFFNYRSIIFSADQKEYVVTLCTQSVKCLKVIVQLAAIAFFSNGYIYWMLLEVLASAISSIFLLVAVRRYYPWLTTKLSMGKLFWQKYPSVISKTKQLFVHKIGIYVLNQTTPIIIYYFMSLTAVAIYGNYYLIMTACTMLIDVMFRGATAGVGNLVVTETRQKVKQTFWRIATVRLWLSSFVCLAIYFLAHAFIELWLGSEFKLGDVALILMISTAFIQMTRTVDLFLNSYGLFSDTWAPIAESLSNILLSVFFGYYWGGVGILAGVLLSQLFFVVFWKAYFLCTQTRLVKPRHYFVKLGKKLLVLLIAGVGSIFLLNELDIPSAVSYGYWLLNACCLIGTYAPISFLMMLVVDRDFREVVHYVVRRYKDFM